MMADGCGHTVSATEMVSWRDLRREVTSVRTSFSEGGGNGDMVPVVLERKDLDGKLEERVEYSWWRVGTGY